MQHESAEEKLKEVETEMEGKSGEIWESDSPKAKDILQGFKICSMTFRDAETGEVMWQDSDWDENTFKTEHRAFLPKEMLDCKVLSREIEFHSDKEISNFALKQRVFFQEWNFSFGFVIPGSTNTWQQHFEADNPLPAHVLSGNVTIETSFMDGEELINKSVIRVFYG